MQTPIKILHVIQKMHSGGVEQRKLLLAQQLPKDTFEQKIICSEADAALRQKFEAAHCEVIEVGQLKHPLDYKIHRHVLQIIKNFKPNIIHGSVFEGNTIAAIDGFLGRVPIILIEETSYPIHRKGRANLLLRSLAIVTHRVIAISPSVQDYLIRVTGLREDKIELICNGVRDPFPLTHQKKLVLRESLKIHQSDFVIGSIGRMENDVKGFDLLIDQFPSIKKKIPNAKLLIIGGGKLLNEYKTIAQKLNVGDDIIFTGYQSEINDFYQIMDVYITLPRSEGFGLTIVEAMSHKLPVIATRVGGIADIIHHGKNGYMLTSPNELLPLLESMRSNELMREKLGQRAYRSYADQFTSLIYIQKLQELYTYLIQK